MLFLSFCLTVFVSVLWLVFSIRLVFEYLGGVTLLDAGVVNATLYILFVCLPLLLVWFVFSFVSQYFNNRRTNKQMHRLFSQMKRNQEYSDLLARIMLETEQNIKSSHVLSHFDLLIADMNELLSEIILKERLVSQEQVEHLWTKVQNGGKWSFGKVIIENYNRQPFFQKKIYADASADGMLAGVIMEFCARYQMLLSLLEKYDREKTFLNIIETGVLGKVYSVFAPVSDEIRRFREVSFESSKKEDIHEDEKAVEEVVKPNIPEFSLKPKKSKKTVISTGFGFFNKVKNEKDEKQTYQKDAFSLALERSFQDEPQQTERAEPSFELSPEPLNVQNETADNVEEKNEETENSLKSASGYYSSEEEIVSKIEVSDTQKVLNDLKKEWQDIEVSVAQKKEDEDFSYPFGGWADADKYQK